MTRFDPAHYVVVIERGKNVREVLNSAPFLATVNDLSDNFMSQIAACPPTDAHLPALRHAHLMQVALSEIVSHMTGLAAAGEEAERIMADLAEAEDDDE